MIRSPLGLVGLEAPVGTDQGRMPLIGMLRRDSFARPQSRPNRWRGKLGARVAGGVIPGVARMLARMLRLARPGLHDSIDSIQGAGGVCAVEGATRKLLHDINRNNFGLGKASAGFQRVLFVYSTP